MAGIFLSYARPDQERAEAVRTALNNAGLDVWYDVEISAGTVWRDEIHRALEKSQVVVVLWSPASVGSEWVKAEAQLAADSGKLIPLIISPVEIPLGFRRIQHLDLSAWDGSPDDPLLRPLLEVARERIRERKEEAPKLPEPDTPGDRVVTPPDRAYSRLRRARRTKVFLAHASADKPIIKPIVMVLIDQEFRLWIDKPQTIGLPKAYESRLLGDRIHFGQDWKDSIRVAVKKANVVLAFWSNDAVKGRREQFHYEVYLGMMARKLHQARIDKVGIDDIGMPYTFDHIASLADFREGEYHPELECLMQDMVNRRSAWW